MLLEYCDFRDKMLGFYESLRCLCLCTLMNWGRSFKTQWSRQSIYVQGNERFMCINITDSSSLEPFARSVLSPACFFQRDVAVFRTKSKFPRTLATCESFFVPNWAGHSVHDHCMRYLLTFDMDKAWPARSNCAFPVSKVINLFVINTAAHKEKHFCALGWEIRASNNPRAVCEWKRTPTHAKFEIRTDGIPFKCNFRICRNAILW